MLALLGTVGLGGWFVKIKVVVKGFCVAATVVVVTCCVAVVVVVVVVAVVIAVVVEVLLRAVTGCPAACGLVGVLEINGADVAGAKFSFGVSLPVEGVFAVDSPGKKFK